MTVRRLGWIGYLTTPIETTVARSHVRVKRRRSVWRPPFYDQDKEPTEETDR